MAVATAAMGAATGAAAAVAVRDSVPALLRGSLPGSASTRRRASPKRSVTAHTQRRRSAAAVLAVSAPAAQTGRDELCQAEALWGVDAGSDRLSPSEAENSFVFPTPSTSAAATAVLEAANSGIGENACALPPRRSLEGAQTYRQCVHGACRRVVPLLSPVADGLPFALALELWEHGVEAEEAASTEAPFSATMELMPPAADSCFELHYVLQGEGTALFHPSLSSPDSAHNACTAPAMLEGIRLRAGDSIVFPPNVARSTAPASSTETNNKWSLATLVLILPSDLVLPSDLCEPQPSHTDKNGDDGGYVVSEGPARELYGGLSQEALSAAAEKAQAIFSAWTCGTPAGALSAAEVEAILAPALASASAAMHTDAKRLSADGAGQLTLQDGEPHVVKRGLQELTSFHLSDAATNRFALVFDPVQDHLPFTFAVEIFEGGHRTPLHTHPGAHELFFILSGEGVAACDGHTFSVGAGDAIVFPPKSLHGLDNVCAPDNADTTSSSKEDDSQRARIYTLELMLPNDEFSSFVRRGRPAGALEADDLCTLIAVGCGGGGGSEEQ
eukprot:jgi/Chlat1/4534/Chrsp29S04455